MRRFNHTTARSSFVSEQPSNEEGGTQHLVSLQQTPNCVTPVYCKLIDSHAQPSHYLVGLDNNLLATPRRDFSPLS
jgi:hypothetical protein